MPRQALPDLRQSNQAGHITNKIFAPRFRGCRERDNRQEVERSFIGRRDLNRHRRIALPMLVTSALLYDTGIRNDLRINRREIANVLYEVWKDCIGCLSDIALMMKFTHS